MDKKAQINGWYIVAAVLAVLAIQQWWIERQQVVWRKDQEIDALNTGLFRELLTFMMENPRNITFCVHMLFCAKNVERMGDHATNIAETVYYVVQGSAIKEERPKADVTSREMLPLRDREKSTTELISAKRAVKKKAACRCKRPRFFLSGRESAPRLMVCEASRCFCRRWLNCAVM